MDEVISEVDERTKEFVREDAESLASIKLGAEDGLVQKNFRLGAEKPEILVMEEVSTSKSNFRNK